MSKTCFPYQAKQLVTMKGHYYKVHKAKFNSKQVIQLENSAFNPNFSSTTANLMGDVRKVSATFLIDFGNEIANSNDQVAKTNFPSHVLTLEITNTQKSDIR